MTECQAMLALSVFILALSAAPWVGAWAIMYYQGEFERWRIRRAIQREDKES